VSNATFFTTSNASIDALIVDSSLLGSRLYTVRTDTNSLASCSDRRDGSSVRGRYLIPSSLSDSTLVRMVAMNPPMRK